MTADSSVGSSDNLPEQDPRVIFAAERTLLAWIRTGIAMMGFGFVVARFGLFIRELALADAGSHALSRMPPTKGNASLWIGVILIFIGVVMNVIATVGHVRTMRRLRVGEPITPNPWSAATMLALILAGLGVVMAIYLLFMR